MASLADTSSEVKQQKMSEEEERPYDIIVFGSTGYTGKFVAEEAYRVQCEVHRGLRWAAAGRNEEKVRATLEASGIKGVDVLVADISDDASLEEMCSKASVVVNCVGPYQLYGEPVIKACIKQKCNYVDITGEPYFMEKMYQQYSQQAKEAGVLLISSCGFDSIPNDIGALYLQRNFRGELAYVDSYMTTTGSGFHVGTWESFLRSIRSHRKTQELRKKRQEEKLPFPAVKPPKKGQLFFSDVVNKWCVAFPGSDRAVVYQSQRSRYETEGTSPFKFRTFFGLQSFCQAICMPMFFLVILLLVSTKWGLSLMLKFPGFFSGGIASKTGPSKHSLEKATFTLTLEGYGFSSTSPERSSTPDKKMVIKIRGAEPGYVATSAILMQSALCMVYEKDALPPGGYLTPSVAFGNTNIIKNLEDTGKFKLEVVES